MMEIVERLVVLYSVCNGVDNTNVVVHPLKSYIKGNN